MVDQFITGVYISIIIWLRQRDLTVCTECARICLQWFAGLDSIMITLSTKRWLTWSDVVDQVHAKIHHASHRDSLCKCTGLMWSCADSHWSCRSSQVQEYIPVWCHKGWWYDWPCLLLDRGQNQESAKQRKTREGELHALRDTKNFTEWTHAVIKCKQAYSLWDKKTSVRIYVPNWLFYTAEWQTSQYLYA